MICRIVKHSEIELLNTETGATVVKCRRCGLDQAEWAVRAASATYDGFRRGLWQATLLAGVTFFTGLLTDLSATVLIGSTGVAFFTALGGRTVEGKMDERKNSAVIESP